jgi:predicted ester cyclase
MQGGTHGGRTLTLEERNKAIVLKLLHRIHAGEMSAMEGHPGLEELRRSIQTLSQPFSDLTVSIDQIIAEGDRVAVHLRYRGTHTGELFGVAATGKSIEYQAVSIQRLEDGLIVHHAAEAGWLRVLLRIGGIPADQGSGPWPCTSS